MICHIKHIIVLIVCTALVSCSSVYYLQIETMKPAQVALHSEGGSRIVLVDNAVAQPENIGFESVSKGKADIPIRFSPHFIDTLIFGGTKQLGRTLEESHFFDAIYFFSQPVRQDAQWMSIAPLSEDMKHRLYEKSGSDVMISIDRVLYLYKQEVAFTPYGTAHVDLKSRATLNCSVHYYGQPDKTKSLVTTDSVEFYLMDVEIDSANLARIPDTFILQNTRNLFDKIAHEFIPQWEVAERTIYTSNGARMQEALAYARKEKWGKAAEQWLSLYEREKQPVSRARLAQNMAVSFEVRDDIAAAVQWMEKCREYYRQAENADSKESTAANNYLQALQQRQLDNKLLDIQLK